MGQRILFFIIKKRTIRKLYLPIQPPNFLLEKKIVIQQEKIQYLIVQRHPDKQVVSLRIVILYKNSSVTKKFLQEFPKEFGTKQQHLTFCAKVLQILQELLNFLGFPFLFGIVLFFKNFLRSFRNYSFMSLKEYQTGYSFRNFGTYKELIRFVKNAEEQNLLSGCNINLITNNQKKTYQSNKNIYNS
eukprot:TRINITY_DN1025_c1_g1_i13.p1 TRINITY_DN1025_c1_g1~~TRINITY_DN1025_c1_g1_i13.p1  ORF type:complete len:187 (+),score=-9.72 TRINITY_DN1025_c1_g1_i13:397-957(+)